VKRPAPSRVSERWLWEKTRTGEIPCLKAGRCTLYPVAMLEAHDATDPADLVSMLEQLAATARQAPPTRFARAVWHMSRDHESKSRRLRLPGGQNLASEPTGLAFTISGEPARLSWEREPVTMTADDALAGERRAGGKETRGRPGPALEKRDEAADWLTAILASGPRPAAGILEQRRDGEGGSKKTLVRAKQRLGVEAYPPATPPPSRCGTTWT